MRVNSGKYGWLIGELVKFALVGVPAVVTLWFLRRLGPGSRNLYYVSFANLCGYLLWLAVMSFITIVDGSQAYRDWLFFSGLPAAFAFFIPFLFSFGSLVLCVLSFLAKQGERAYLVFFNMLMLLLWIVSVVAPN
jgi:hypothetical protein